MTHPITTPEAALEAAAHEAKRWLTAAEKRLEKEPDNELYEEQMSVSGSIEYAIRRLASRIPPVSPDVAGLVELYRGTGPRDDDLVADALACGWHLRVYDEVMG